MIPCTSCGKSFVFGRVADIDTIYEAFVRADLQRVGAVEVLEEEVVDGAVWLRETFAEFEPGDIVVYLDGCYFRADATSVGFEGLFARHSLDELPHAVALADNDHLRRIMGDPKYWFDRERPSRHDDN